MLVRRAAMKVPIEVPVLARDPVKKKVDLLRQPLVESQGAKKLARAAASAWEAEPTVSREDGEKSRAYFE